MPPVDSGCILMMMMMIMMIIMMIMMMNMMVKIKMAITWTIFKVGGSNFVWSKTNLLLV